MSEPLPNPSSDAPRGAFKHPLLRYLPLGDAILAERWRWVAVVVGLALLVSVQPFFFGGFKGFEHRFISSVIVFSAICAILALGLNVVVGFTGLLDLGYVTFLATGAIVAFQLLLLTHADPQAHRELRAYRAVGPPLRLSAAEAQGVLGQDPGALSGKEGFPAAQEGGLEVCELATWAERAGAAFDRAKLPEPARKALELAADARKKRLRQHGHLFGRFYLPVGTNERIAGTRPFVFGNSWPLVMLVAGLVCAGLGALRGIPTLRLTGDYYAIVTLGIAEIFYLVYLNASWIIGGAESTTLRTPDRPHVLGKALFHDTPVFYYLVMGALLLTLLLMDRLARSRTGRAWAAIRLDELAAGASGIDVPREKLKAFAVSGFCGGVAGSLYAIWQGSVSAKDLDVWWSVLVLCAVVLGGMGSLRGVLLASMLFFPMREVLREKVSIGGASFRVPPQAVNLVYGMLLIFVMRFRPQGLLPRGHEESQPLTPEQERALASDERPRLFALEERQGG
ncbi:MAG: branched-chain amino acid ABC transporter permease [Planctomycetota bacterium]